MIELGVVRKIRTDLEITNDGDYFVVLGLAEKLAPGSYVALRGDPSSIEEKFIELFENF
jgi:hypothetical protein